MSEWLIKIDWVMKKTVDTRKFRIFAQEEPLEDAVKQAIQQTNLVAKKLAKFIAEISVCRKRNDDDDGITKEGPCLYWWRHDCRMDYLAYYRKWKKDHNIHIELTVRTYGKKS